MADPSPKDLVKITVPQMEENFMSRPNTPFRIEPMVMQMALERKPYGTRLHVFFDANESKFNEVVVSRLKELALDKEEQLIARQDADTLKGLFYMGLPLRAKADDLNPLAFVKVEGNTYYHVILKDPLLAADILGTLVEKGKLAIQPAVDVLQPDNWQAEMRLPIGRFFDLVSPQLIGNPEALEKLKTSLGMNAQLRIVRE